jgi:hypothetical protein
MAVKIIPQIIRRYLGYCPYSGNIYWRSNITLPSIRIVSKRAGWDSNGGYRYITFNKSAYLAHRVAWFLFYGVQPPEFIDHMDTNKSNNRIWNLREIDYTGNLLNVTKKTSGKSGIRGVWFDKRRGSWQAFINLHKKRHPLYYGQDFFEACCARKSAESAYWSVHS